MQSRFNEHGPAKHLALEMAPPDVALLSLSSAALSVAAPLPASVAMGLSMTTKAFR